VVVGSRAINCLHFLIRSLVVSICATACTDPLRPISVDARYSEFLSVLSAQYKEISGNNASSTVGVIQIFTGGQNDVSSLPAATRGELLFESRSREVIDHLFQAIQQDIENGGASSPCDLGKGSDWILVAYDSMLPRVGVIQLYSCGEADEKVIGIRPAGDAAITYSRDARAALEARGLSK
jgi:hypothetical protein